MVRAKNYETMSTFVKVMQKKLWPLFSRTRCSIQKRLKFSDSTSWTTVHGVLFYFALGTVFVSRPSQAKTWDLRSVPGTPWSPCWLKAIIFCDNDVFY